MAKIREAMRRLRRGIVRVVKRYPVETALALYGCAGAVLTYEFEWRHAPERLLPAVLFFALALALNRLAGSGPWRKVYYVCWAPLVPLSLWSGLEAWVFGASFALSLGVMAPLLLLMSGRARSNGRFVGEGLIWLRALLLGVLYANAALALFLAVYLSTVYIFGWMGPGAERVAVYATIIAELLAVPVLWLMTADADKRERVRAGRAATVLLDYLLSPAVIAYTAILYLYAIRILTLWSLPKGGVAYLVFGFFAAALLAKALQCVLDKQRYAWFYDRFSLIALPLLALFWVGAAQRIAAYGLTIQRVYLVACGLLMTVCVVLFLWRRTGRYLWVCLAGFVLFGALAYAPPLDAERLAVDSQVRRALRSAARLGALDAEGRIDLRLYGADTSRWREYHRLDRSLEYVAEHDTTALRRLGIPPEVDWRTLSYRHYLKCFEVSETFSLDLEAEAAAQHVGRYRTLYTHMPYRYDGRAPSARYESDTLVVYLPDRPALRIPGERLMRSLLARAGFGPKEVPETDSLRAHARAMRVYDDGERMILFESVSFSRSDSLLRLLDARVDAVLMP